MGCKLKHFQGARDLMLICYSGRDRECGEEKVDPHLKGHHNSVRGTRQSLSSQRHTIAARWEWQPSTARSNFAKKARNLAFYIKLVDSAK